MQKKQPAGCFFVACDLSSLTLLTVLPEPLCPPSNIH
jgi:hypothetical protein